MSFTTDRPATWQACIACGNETTELDARSRCARCGGLLEVQHRPPDLTRTELLQRFTERRGGPRSAASASGVWRFRDMVMPSADRIVSYPEGNTPLLTRPALDDWSGIDGLQLKHEGQNPTGSFKDRGMTVGVTQALRIGASAVACASTGNTAASLAAYAAQAGLPALVLMPAGAVAAGKLAQALAYGARTLVVPGDFDACLRLAEEASASLGVYLLNSINPFRLEGQKTIILELLQQLAWEPPDWIVVPAGNLGNLSAFGKALRELHAYGLISRLPRLVGVQAAGAAPFAASFARGFDRLDVVVPETAASAIRIGHPASYERAVRAIRETDGLVLAVPDAELIEAKAALDRSGVGGELASAAALAGARRLSREGTIAAGATVVVVLTGHILKDADTLLERHRGMGPGANPPRPISGTLSDIEAELRRAP